MYEVKVREVEAQLVLTETRYGNSRGLSRWMGSAFGRGWKRSQKYGGSIGHYYAVIHGKLGPDDWATVEVCIPVAFDQEIPQSEPHRIELAHKEAFTRITKRQVKQANVVDAYMAVVHWIEGNDKKFLLAAREVYFTDFMAAGPDDETTDIAYPFTD